MDAICAELTDSGIEKALARVPEDMNATYERILDIINKKPRPQRELARRVLIWTAYARSPLPIDTLTSAISIERDTKSLKDLKSSIQTEKNILNVCANLISIDRSSPRYVRFVHFSIQEFLTSYQSRYIETLSMGHEIAHREIAQTCMILLTVFPKQRDFLGLYAFDEWPHHLLAGIIQADEKILPLTLSFFNTSPLVLIKQPLRLEEPWNLIKAYLKFSPLVLALIFDLPSTQKCREGEQSKATEDPNLRCMILPDDKLAIHYATAELDSVPVAQRLYNYGYSVNYLYCGPDEQNHKVPDMLQISSIYSVQSIQMTRFLLDNDTSIEPQYLHNDLIDPLEYFVNRGDLGIEVLQLLLDRLEVVDQNGERFGRALQAAAWIGNIEAILLLLDNGADVNMQGGEHGNALQAAVLKGDIEVIQLLLDKEADVNTQGGGFGNALQASVWAGDVEVIRLLLLDKGANIHAQGGRYGSVLQAAAWKGNVKVIQLLLDEGADVNIQGGEYGSALQAAACDDNMEAIQLLLDKGVNVNIQGGKYGSALQAAVWKGNVEVIQLLLDKGADVNIQGGEYGSALQAAICDDNEEVIQLLLDKGADVNIQGGEYGSALQAAVYVNNEEVIQTLLDKGADVNTQGGEYGSALQAAVYDDNVEVIQLLLDTGADVNLQGGKYNNALQAAVWRGNVEAILLLLENGADVNMKGGEYGNALQAAVWRGDIEVIRLLLDKGADVNIQSGRGDTGEFGNVLQAAVWAGDVEVIRLLLDRGADINAQGGRYSSVLQAVACKGDAQVIQLLLDRGADVNIQGGKYGNALQAAAWMGNVDVIRLLLDKGANIHAQGGKYGTALQAALAPGLIKSDILPVVELLLDYGADIMTYVPDSEYGNALTAAKQIWKQDKHNLDLFMKLLSSRGLKVDEAESNKDVPEASQKLKEGRIGLLLHVWKLLGFAFLVYILYALIQFWI